MLSIQWHLQPIPVASEAIQTAAKETLTQQAATGDVTVVLSDDAELRKLNRQYLGIDASTDVLSFPAGDRDPESGVAYLGDVIISIARAEMQARVAGRPLESEVQLLVVHGILHLLGYDHAEPEDKARMWSAQAEVLRRLGLHDSMIEE